MNRGVAGWPCREEAAGLGSETIFQASDHELAEVTKDREKPQLPERAGTSSSFWHPAISDNL
jgi:hypothetical protein